MEHEIKFEDILRGEELWSEDSARAGIRRHN